MKLLIPLLLTSAAFAQTVAAPNESILAPVGSITVTIVNQGADVINTVTGKTVPGATLLDATVCNEGAAQVTIDNAMVYQRVNSRTTQGLTLYDSQVVTQVLAIFQNSNIFAKLFKAGNAMSSVSSILQLAFKFSPVIGAAMQVAPSIYTAVLPVIHSPSDIAALSASIIQQSVGGVIAGHSCRSGIVVAKTSLAAVKTEVLTVQ
jgi:hypothetical protein